MGRRRNRKGHKSQRAVNGPGKTPEGTITCSSPGSAEMATTASASGASGRPSSWVLVRGVGKIAFNLADQLRGLLKRVREDFDEKTHVVTELRVEGSELTSLVQSLDTLTVLMFRSYPVNPKFLPKDLFDRPDDLPEVTVEPKGLYIRAFGEGRQVIDFYKRLYGNMRGWERVERTGFEELKITGENLTIVNNRHILLYVERWFGVPSPFSI